MNQLHILIKGLVIHQLLTLKDGDILLEENKTLVRNFFVKANNDRGTPVDMCAKDFTAHIGGTSPLDLQAFERY